MSNVYVYNILFYKYVDVLNEKKKIIAKIVKKGWCLAFFLLKTVSTC